MTLPPTTDWDLHVVGIRGSRPKLPDVCSVPGCNAARQDAHHIFRRSGLGNFAWVEIGGKVVCNLASLCRTHHDGVTGRVGGHRYWIRWHEERFLWCRVVPAEDNLALPAWVPVGPLDPQPPVRESPDVSQPDDDKPEPDRCPSCGHPRRRAPAIGAAGARRRKSWLVKVPDDHEDGADVLDTLVDDLVPLLGLDPGASARYHVLVPVLVYAQQDKRSFARAIAGIGGGEES